MKIIDEKGKLFGKLNIIDLLAILVILIALVFVGVRLLGRGNGTTPGGTPAGATKLTYTAQASGITPVIYDEVCRQLLNAGGKDQLMANGQMLDAYVVGVTAVPHVNYQPDATGLVTATQETGEGARYDLVFTVEANVTDTLLNTVGTQEVRVAKAHILKTTHFEFASTVILTCEWE